MLVIGQGLLVGGFVWRLWSFKRSLIVDSKAPTATVILCLRGGDPFLLDCLLGLLRQDYPRYDVQLVIDHPQDPACAIVEQAQANDPRGLLKVQFLRDPLYSCSLKCSSVAQVIRGLDAQVEFVALIDADTIPHASWLRELATALQDERVGAATGNRWYMPTQRSIASLVRYSWNAAAIVQMYWYRIAWGGTLAVKTDVFRQSALLDKWSHAFCEDTMLHKQLSGIGRRVEFVPSLMMVNREECELPGFFRWVSRQLLTARLYHPAWLGVAAHGVLTNAALLFALVVAVWAWWLQADAAAAMAGLSLLFYQLAVVLMLPPMEYAVRRIVAARGQPTRWLGIVGVVKFLAASLLTHFVYAAALVSASRLRCVEWRGVHYQIDGPWKIRLLKYQPYQTQATESKTSL